MPIRFFSAMQKASRRRSSKGSPVTMAQREALQERMEKAFTVSYNNGITRMRGNVDKGALEQAFYSRNYDSIMEQINIGSLGKYMDEAAEKLAETIRRSAAIERKQLPQNVSDNLRLTTQNENLKEYLNVRTGMLIQNVEESTQVMVQQAVQSAFAGGLTPKEVAAQIKDNIGLTVQQAQAVNNFQGSDFEKEEYRRRLLDMRKETIARTEISFASNQGQLAVWDAAAQDGLIDADAPKKWLVDGDPCANICEPMDGVTVARDEDFELPDGTTVPCPPAHPRCRCQMVLDVGDNTSSNRQNYAEPYRVVDGDDE